MHNYVLASQSNSTEINFDDISPWFYPFFGTLAMGAGQLFGDNLYAIMSNAGVLIFVITILILMNEVDKDMVANDDVACFLVQVAQKGDEIRVSPSPQPDERGHQICEGEEMRTVDDEHGSAVFSDINAVTFDPKHDDDRAGSAPDERPDQDYGSDQCETHKKNADETIEEVSFIKSMPDKEIDVDVEDESSLPISAPNDRSGQINRSDQCETLNMNDGKSIKEVSFMNSMPDKDSDIEHEPSLPDIVQSVGDQAEGEQQVMLTLP
ncbi:hypothetical protein ACHAW5_003967 [Stephanodiscus triporus]|uniref:Uncharacterized protein n=1 Tax=Stephanodiscus triporus TaxID=2934178 RepID=A0ABD3N5G4_9STRA